MSKFNVNFRDIVKSRIPHFLRTINVLSFMYSAIKPLRKLNSATLAADGFEGLYALYTRLREFLFYNGQTIYLERYLNTEYDPVNQGIYIVNTGGAYINFLFNQSELATDTFLFNESEALTIIYAYNESEVTTLAGFDFIVYVPNTVAYSTNVMRKQIDQYRIAGKRYNIIVY